MQQISNIQKLREDQFRQDQIKKNILYINEHFNIRFACLNGFSEDITKSSIRNGYFQVSESYNTIEEALDHMNAGQNILILISDIKYAVGNVCENLQDALPGIVYNLYNGKKVADQNPIPAYDLDDIRTPKQFLNLYERVSEYIPELKSILETIEIPETDPDLDCRKWIAETWVSIHESLNIPEENRIIKGLTYTDFTI